MSTIDTIYLIYGVNGGHAGSLPLAKDEMPKRREPGCQRNQINGGKGEAKEEDKEGIR